MIEEKPGLLAQVRDKFAHVDSCPFTGPRVFFENAGGALTLKSTVETSAKFAGVRTPGDYCVKLALWQLHTEKEVYKPTLSEANFHCY